MHFPGYPLYVGRIALGGGYIDLRKISLVVLARQLHRVQIAFMSMVKGGAAYYNAVLGCRAREG